MASTIQEHIEYIRKHGIARTNRFQVKIPLPPMMNDSLNSNSQEKTTSIFGEDVFEVLSSFSGSGSSEITRGLAMMIEDTSIPGKSLATTNIRYNGDFVELPYSAIYEAQTFTFAVSQDMYERNIMDHWMDFIFDPRAHTIGYMDDYATDIVIDQLNIQDEIVYSSILKDAFPTQCNPLPVSNEDQNNFHRLAITFAFRKWIRSEENKKSGNDPLVDSLSQTPFGPYIQDVISNPVIQKGLDTIESYTGIDLEGEALSMYNKIDEIVRSTTDQTVNQTISLLEAIKGSIGLNGEITDDQAARLLDIVDDVLGNLRS